MKVTIIGAGYVGLTTAAAMAYTGHEVHCIDKDTELIKELRKGNVHFHEPGIIELLSMELSLSFGDWETFDRGSDLIFIAVGTPPKSNGDADLAYIELAAYEIGRRAANVAHINVVIKSTVPVGTAQKVQSIISQVRLKSGDMDASVTVASNPEFLREGAALFDTFYPGRIVVGSESSGLIDMLDKLYKPILTQTISPPAFLPRPKKTITPAFISTTTASAELIKYASNAFLAMKISFINEFAGLAEFLGADIEDVAMGIGLDRRIGPEYLQAGVGWGGSCFGKDIGTTLATAKKYDYNMHLLEATVMVNNRQREAIIEKLVRQLKEIRGANIGILGVSFKPETDDVRDAPFLAISRMLHKLGANVKAHDPVAVSNCMRKHPQLPVTYCNEPEEAAENADALLILTEWEQYQTLNYAAIGQIMRQKLLIDGRNMLNSEQMRQAGFIYIGVG
ncbi:UDP-glucose/GDP-mannose dehydrogenase family protein [Metallumcola ferriviriculae]|uniref:UDP-glucose 6-dehydrogenase n=1 Tax=Metallumcola ferriviriculae TaxID=3039180 RepID=A0AAU0UML9_9FIRM|nr:UDP-glucose/GDP-mannose dehydrogenase family protein [Desulfitibacteraceae bacterium MK1]